MTPLVIDADGHVEEDIPTVIRSVPESMRALAPRYERDEDGSFLLVIEGKPWRPTYPQPHGAKTHVSAGAWSAPVAGIRWSASGCSPARASTQLSSIRASV